MIATKRTEVRIRGVDEDYLRESYQKKTGYEIDLKGIEWDGDYDQDGIGFSYLTGIGEVLLQGYKSADSVEDAVCEDTLAEDVILDEKGVVIASVGLETLTQLAIDRLLEQYGYLRSKEPYHVGMDWEEKAMGSYEGTLVIVLDEKKVLPVGGGL